MSLLINVFVICALTQKIAERDLQTSLNNYIECYFLVSLYITSVNISVGKIIGCNIYRERMWWK